jgi:hypothetical protein
LFPLGTRTPNQLRNLKQPAPQEHTIRFDLQKFDSAVDLLRLQFRTEPLVLWPRRGKDEGHVRLAAKLFESPTLDEMAVDDVVLDKDRDSQASRTSFR